MAEPLKNQFDIDEIRLIGERFATISPSFDRRAFETPVVAALPALELKDRINLVADAINAALSEVYREALTIVVAVALSGIEGFAAWPLCSFVERHGLGAPEESLKAMPILTRSWTCEFAVRPFLENELALTMSHVHRWAQSEHDAVRRLASEGTRPRLPWGPRVAALTADPTIGVAVLTELRHDPSDDVRRSVANHLNDIAREDPELVVEVLEEWTDDPTTDPTMVRHALRTLVKQGHKGALAVLGFTTDPAIEVGNFSVTPDVISLGDQIELRVEIRSVAARETQRLVVDFVVHHVNARGGTTPKVFKWTTIEPFPGERIELTKKRRIQTATTRRYHAGAHRVDLQVAGEVVATASFDLTESS